MLREYNIHTDLLSNAGSLFGPCRHPHGTTDFSRTVLFLVLYHPVTVEKTGRAAAYAAELCIVTMDARCIHSYTMILYGIDLRLVTTSIHSSCPRAI